MAVVPPVAALDAVEELAAQLHGELPHSARRTPRAHWHLTLQFLGDRADLDGVAAALSNLAVRSGDVALGGVGAFPTARRARVIFLGVAAGAEWLAQVSAAVGVVLAPLGHEPERRDYTPHLTLARAKAPLDARTMIDRAAAGRVGEAFTVSELVLFESVLGPTGAQHRVHASFPLGA